LTSCGTDGGKPTIFVEGEHRIVHIALMSEVPDNIVLVYLREIDAKVDRLTDDVQDLKHRVTSLEGEVAGLRSETARIRGDLAAMSLRIDRIETRLDRIERRLDLVAAATA